MVAVGDVGRRELAERIALRVAQVEPSDDPGVAAQRRFRASGLAYVEHVLEQPGLFQVACRHDEGRAAGADPYALLQRCVDDLVDAGVLPESRRADAPVAAWASVHGLAVLLTEGPPRRLSPARRQAVVDRTLDVVERGL